MGRMLCAEIGLCLSSKTADLLCLHKPRVALSSAMLCALVVAAWTTVLVPAAMAQQPGSLAVAELREASPPQRSAILRRLQVDPSIRLMDVAKAISQADPVQKNLYLGVAQSIYARDRQAGRIELEKIVNNKQLDAAIRYWAFEELTLGDEKSRQAMLQTMLDDPALEIRYEAVKLGQAEAKQLKENGGEPAQLKRAYQRLITAARLPEQVQEVAASLKELGEEVNLLEHFGFIANWQVIGPFDNREKRGFNVDYGPEKAYLAAPMAAATGEFEGKEGKVTWQPVTTREMDGAVDLNPVFANAKGAIAYALADFTAPKGIDCEVRLGCINANKVWVNGQPLISNEVYHASSQIDQYTAPVQLKQGKNTILIKVCQNEQTEQWAQDWKFQLRFTDASGQAIPPAK